jgi:hypothetical protein
MSEDEITRGVLKALQEQERRRSEGTARSLLAGVAILAVFFVAFILVVTYG